MLTRPMLSLLSPAGRRARLSILIFHRVHDVSDPLFPGDVDRAQFDRVCGWVKSWCNVLPLDEAVQRLASGSLPARAVAITFDDGYADNHRVALPVLRRHGLTATFFIATGFLDGGRMWNDTIIEAIRRTSIGRLDLRQFGHPALGEFALDSDAARRIAVETILPVIKYLPSSERGDLTRRIADLAKVSLPNDLMMTATQVIDLRRSGMQIGAHTVSHPILAVLDDDAAREEICTSRHVLEALLGERVGLFAYPNGKPGRDFSSTSVAIARQAGFDAAVSTAPGTACSATDAFLIPRFTPWDRTRGRFGARLAHNLVFTR
jgi:peptidoglycan/xylan/chitin deacetylase (PgdA/CDA1 family)